MTAPKLKSGTIVARVEAPTVYYRVASTPAPGFARVLPYKRSGKEHILFYYHRNWTGDDSIWTIISTP